MTDRAPLTAERLDELSLWIADAPELPYGEWGKDNPDKEILEWIYRWEGLIRSLLADGPAMIALAQQTLRDAARAATEGDEHE